VDVGSLRTRVSSGASGALAACRTTYAGLSPNARRGVLAGGAALAALLLVVGSVSAHGWVRDRGLNRALSTAAEATDTVLGGLAGASTLDEVAAAAGNAAEALAAIDSSVADAGTSRAPFARPAYRVLDAQTAVLEAVQPLSTLSEDSLTAWGTVLPSWTAADAALDASLGKLRAVAPGAPRPTTDLDRARTNTVAVVGAAAADTLRRDLEGFVTELASVGNTTGAASLGQRSTKAATAAETAAEGQRGRRARTLTQLTAAFGALGGLSRMEPESLHVWEGARQEFTDAAGKLGVDASAAVASMDAWVLDAQEQMDAWRADFAAAEAARSDASGQLDTYGEQVRDALRRYTTARDSLSDVVADTSRSSYDVEAALADAHATRTALRDELNALPAPTGLLGAHAAFPALLERSMAVVAQGLAAVQEWNQCWASCPASFRDLPAWQEFETGSTQVSADFEIAREAWDAALEDALGGVDAIPLPPMPDL